jgi:ParB family transcriptional regulator, chromosome partitioning protein
LRGSAEGIEESPAGKALAERRAAWERRLPEAANELWDWLLAQDLATRLDLLAYSAGCSVNAVRKPHEQEDAEHFGDADRLADPKPTAGLK